MLTDTSGETQEEATQQEIGEESAGVKADHTEPEYLEWSPASSPISIHMHLGAVDGIARDVLEGVGGSPGRDAEVGGLLLGRVESSGDRHVVWIERYQRISCEYSFGPHFVLGGKDTTALEEAATKIFEIGEMAVVGLYRSHTRPGLQLEHSDFELIRRYFSDPSDLVLLVKPGKGNSLFAQFYRFDSTSGAHPVGEGLPFRGNVVTPDAHLPDTQMVTPDTTRTTGEPAEDREGTTQSPIPAAPESAPKPQRRLVPDFPSSPVEPAPSLFGLAGPHPPEPTEPKLTQSEMADEAQTTGMFSGPGVRKWLPLLAAILLVGGIVAFFVLQGRNSNSAPAGLESAETARPLGLYVDPLPQNWRVLWNPNATALRDARNVQLFVREGDDQNRVELTPRDLALASYAYKPGGNDVTFRLEVVGKDGHISAESFRLIQAGAQAGAQPVAASATPTAPLPKTTPPSSAGLTTQPKPTYKAPPVVAAGIRPRIKGTIPVDVRVRIDERGHVASATQLTKTHDGLEQYLASRALQAARLWRFEPARENGKAVAGTQTLHFVFTK